MVDASFPAKEVGVQPETIVAALIALALAHRPQWSWARMRRVCSCGGELPCRKLAPLPVDLSAQR
jgi:hypothetical protein